MNDLELSSCILYAINSLRNRKICVMETHIHKVLYISSAVFRIPFGLDFVLYKYGPYSFELRNQIGKMMAQKFIAWEFDNSFSRPCFKDGNLGRVLKKQFHQSYKKYSKEIDYVIDQAGAKNLRNLELVSLAVYLIHTARVPPAERVDRIRRTAMGVLGFEAEEALQRAGVLLAGAEDPALSLSSAFKP